MDFDLSPIPDDANVEEAVLELFFVGGDIAVAGKPNVCSLFTVTREWVESEVTWNDADAGTKWEMLDLDTKFFNPDLNDTVSSPGGGDYDPASVTVAEYAALNTWEEYDVTEIIREVIDKQDQFHGFIIKQFLDPREKNRSNQGKAYYSSEYDELDKRPKLTITYTSSGINTTILNQLSDNINIVRKDEKIMLFIPFKKANEVLVYNIKGQKQFSLTAGKSGWIDLPLYNLSSGLHIVTIKSGQKSISKRFFILQ